MQKRLEKNTKQVKSKNVDAIWENIRLGQMDAAIQ